ncbi:MULTISPECIES: recombinase family protein [Bacillus cereus group]|uniref:Site-specific recombinase, resolvase family (DNA invertase-like protein) n=1 Tax=Bacillus cereus (strain Q1) TaxID=361100 RepID=B9IZ62_BACCQ|nr:MULTISPECIES: recombinase family protein [Bacillus cereus group]ACM14701.1 site-specific recombinase, resolvase family (DNA invertase-like protein) [Bacillus cereus Q1]MBY5227615.1 resolvase [Bacillus paranthracis]MCY9249691.1 recombinase family protein [Bacillus paranthracis]MDA1498367.1 recombinase family protein [Bacillus cereus group sp. TH41-1LC]MDA1682984.1 recombinase family protein [Bacillus cereus group sp. m2-21]
MKYGYARVSTVTQDLESQLQTLKAEGCDVIYSEKFTGTTTDRPELSKVLTVLSEGDTLTVTKLDRLARNTKEGIEIIEALFKRGIRVHVLNVGLLEDTTMGRFFLQTLLAVAEMERNLILERTQEGKIVARQNPNYKEGRPKSHSDKKLVEAMRMKEKMGYSFRQLSEATGISMSTLQRFARKQRDQQEASAE